MNFKYWFQLALCPELVLCVCSTTPPEYIIKPTRYSFSMTSKPQRNTKRPRSISSQDGRRRTAPRLDNQHVDEHPADSTLPSSPSHPDTGNLRSPTTSVDSNSFLNPSDSAAGTPRSVALLSPVPPVIRSEFEQVMDLSELEPETKDEIMTAPATSISDSTSTGASISHASKATVDDAAIAAAIQQQEFSSDKFIDPHMLLGDAGAACASSSSSSPYASSSSEILGARSLGEFETKHGSQPQSETSTSNSDDVPSIQPVMTMHMHQMFPQSYVESRI